MRIKMLKKSAGIIIVFLLFLSGCDSGLRIVEISIYQFPKRIAYFIGQDNEIDLTGLKITVKSSDDNNYIAAPTDDDFYDMFSVTDDVDFDTVGIYLV
ncbi:MAG: hypothetical protein K2K41_09165, partial [Ruminiclostridium sp.]|nr:hypothetical protein [Ruminiclostridium sp.]